MLNQVILNKVPIHIPNLKESVDYILGIKTDKNEEISKNGNLLVLTYGLIHKLYIHTPEGMNKVRRIYAKGVFGNCQRVYCNNQHLLPYGIYEKPGYSPVKGYCPCCKDIYSLLDDTHIYIDGALFGNSFAHLFELAFPFLFKKVKPEFVGTVFGFKMHKSSRNHPPKIIFNNDTKRLEVVPLPVNEFINPNSVNRMLRNFITEITETLTV